MIYTISQHKINTQCVGEYTKIQRTFNQPSCEASCEGQRKDSLSNLIVQTKLRRFLQKGLLQSSYPITTRLSRAQLEATFPSSLLQHYDIKSFKSNEINPSKPNANQKNLCVKLHQNGSYLKRSKDSKQEELQEKLNSKIKKSQLRSPDYLWGILLFTRDEVAFVNLCSLLSSLLKALHVCLFAALNNKRILFIGDPQPLFQEYQQRLLGSFIANQVNSFSTKMTQLLPPFLPTLSKNRVSTKVSTKVENKGSFTAAFSQKLAKLEGLDSEHKAPLKKKALMRQKFHVLPTKQPSLDLTIPKKAGSNVLNVPSKIATVACETYEDTLSSTKLALNKNLKTCYATNLFSPKKHRLTCSHRSQAKANKAVAGWHLAINQRSSGNAPTPFFTNLHVLLNKSKASFSSKEDLLNSYEFNFAPNLQSSNKSPLVLQSMDYTKSKVKTTSHSLNDLSALKEPSFFQKINDETLRTKTNYNKFVLGKSKIENKLNKKKAFKLLREPLNNQKYVIGEGFYLSKTSRKKVALNESSELQKPVFTYSTEQFGQEPCFARGRKTKQTAKLGLVYEKQKKQRIKFQTLDTNNSNFTKASHLSPGETYQPAKATKLEKKAGLNDRNFVEQTEELSQNLFFHTGMVKLVNKAAIRSGQWTATLAQPTNLWMGGFFSNSLATYKQKLSSTSLFNIKLDAKVQLQEVLINGKPFLDFFPIPAKTLSLLQPPVKQFSSELWTNLYAPVPRKSLVNNLEETTRDYKHRRLLLKGFRGQFFAGKKVRKGSIYSRAFAKRTKKSIYKKLRQKVSTGVLKTLVVNKKNKLLKSFRQSTKLNFSPILTKSAKSFHKKVISHCNNSIEMNITSNAWLKEADLVFFMNPEKTLSLLNQVNRLKIPTLGILSSGSNLAFPLRSAKSSGSLSSKPTINYPIFGNANSLHFLRLVLTKFACVLGKKRL